MRPQILHNIKPICYGGVNCCNGKNISFSLCKSICKKAPMNFWASTNLKRAKKGIIWHWHPQISPLSLHSLLHADSLGAMLKTLDAMLNVLDAKIKTPDMTSHQSQFTVNRLISLCPNTKPILGPGSTCNPLVHEGLCTSEELNLAYLGPRQGTV